MDQAPAQETGDARFWSRIARNYAKGPVADVAGYERTLEHTRRYLKPADAVVEFGCGTGTTALKLAPAVARFVASDLSAGMIAIARERAAAAPEAGANIEFGLATPDAAPWPDETFDAALAFNVLHLMAPRDGVLKGVHRLLKPGGVFISKTPCLKEMNPLARVGVRVAVGAMRAVGQAPTVAFFTGAELEREIEAAGFAIEERARHASRGKDRRAFLVARKR